MRDVGDSAIALSNLYFSVTLSSSLLMLIWVLTGPPSTGVCYKNLGLLTEIGNTSYQRSLLNVIEFISSTKQQMTNATVAWLWSIPSFLVVIWLALKTRHNEPVHEVWLFTNQFISSFNQRKPFNHTTIFVVIHGIVCVYIKSHIIYHNSTCA